MTIATLGAVLTFLPRIAPAIKGPHLAELASLAEFNPDHTPLIPWRPHPVDEVEHPLPLIKKNIAPLLEDANRGLDDFYAALWRTERKEPNAITRITHYGDSPTTADLITGDIRAQLQAHFGDAGHGFILLAKPWAWYQHRSVSLDGSGWQILPATHFETKDGLFGLGGVSFSGGASSHTRVQLADPGQSHFELYYLQQPNGGTVTVTSGNQAVAEIPTAGDANTPGFAVFDVAGGAS